MITEYVIYHVYSIEGRQRRVAEARFADHAEAAEYFTEVVARRGRRRYELMREESTQLARSEAEPEAFRFGGGAEDKP